MSFTKEELIDTIKHALETNPKWFKLDNIIKKYTIDVEKCTRYRIKLNCIKILSSEGVSFVKSAGRTYNSGLSFKGAVRSFITKALKILCSNNIKNLPRNTFC